MCRPCCGTITALTPGSAFRSASSLSALLAVVIGYPCFRLKVVGHYFALVTLALSQVVLLSLVGRARHHRRLARLHAENGRTLLVRAAVSGEELFLRHRAVAYGCSACWSGSAIDRGISREALEAISEDEDAAAAVGINVLREKLRVTVISAALTALGGAIYAQYIMYLNPESVSGIAVSLQIVFAAVAGGVYSLLGPTVGALLTISLTEGLRVWFGATFIGAANTIYGVLLVLCIIFMPQGIVGALPGVKLAPRRPRPSRRSKIRRRCDL